MASQNYLEIAINNFRNIKSAEIHLNGITVLSGINGSGKSTISKLVYGIISSLNTYDSSAVRLFSKKIYPLGDALLDFYMMSSPMDEDMSGWKSIRDAFRPKSINDVLQLGNTVDDVCERIYAFIQQNAGRKKLVDRYKTILLRRLDIEDDLSLKETFQEVQNKIKQMVSEVELQVARRPSFLIYNQLQDLFGAKIENNVELREFGDKLFGKNMSYVPNSHYIKTVIYIDTPFLLDFGIPEKPHWRAIENMIKEPIRTGSFSMRRLSDDISNIINGEVRYSKDDQFQQLLLFKDRYGNEFQMHQGATGIKAFALMQLLLKSGYINEDTLLILDEPEAHLHPQWIIEYARIIVHMRKIIGVNFLISSHSTDMVSAIKYIAENENIVDGLEFYCARRAQDGTGRYNFRSVGLNIEPIFESFNKSYRILDKYRYSRNEDEE